MVERHVFERRFGEVVRLEVQDGMPDELSTLLLDELRDESGPGSPPLTERDLQIGGSLLELGDLPGLAALRDSVA